ncbi:MAG: Signal peptidase I [uncultured Pyrinomonadaceae bacterium]|uniref:Signal peptidase I n=1 Tax=uncultured Pyrinomonadaceae bacterium TaxID=2283094 RepID=A0A6J4P728_9BACT|nr:MAG: Signal peptidase I [uncultured Pyrinomonadaceae bacterium]
MSENEKEIKNPAETRPLGPPKSTVREYFESFVVTLIMAIFGMTFILQAVTVPTGSMQNTILIGDYLLVNKFIFAPSGNPVPFLPQRDVERGDIIVFKYPGNKVNPRNDSSRGIVPYQINYVKRVIGLPGETVEFRNNQVFINGQLLPERRIIGDAEDEESALTTREFEPPPSGEKYSAYYSESTMNNVLAGRRMSRSGYEFGVEGKPMQVPENHFFVMGDSRDNSEDSRYWGFVPRELIIGRAMFVYWSCDRAASNGNFFGCLTNPRLDRIGKMIK